MRCCCSTYEFMYVCSHNKVSTPGTHRLYRLMVYLTAGLEIRAGFAANSEFCQYKVEELARIHPGVEQKRCLRGVLVQPVEKSVDERCLACSHLARKGDNTFSGLNAVHQTRQGFLNLFRKKQIPG